MSCYKDGGCGAYEMYSCSECPASKPEYSQRCQPKEKKINIVRKRYVIVRINNIGNTAIKTYVSEKMAWASFEKSWRRDNDKNQYEVVEVNESLCSTEGGE
jgi:hypothetical protein